MLKVTDLRKEYNTVVAVDGVSLEVKRGELFGLLGPNGAGKTTTIRTVLNIIKPNSGEITFDGKPFTEDTWNIIGYLPEERGLYRKSKIINTVLYFASLKGISAKRAKPLAYYWLNRFGLKNEGHRKIEELSKGNQQKIQLIISILHNPQLLILDEPFTGLDPVNQILLKDVLLELRQKNTAIIFSTHQMEQVEKMCDNICLINKGKPVLSGDLYDIKKKYGTNSVHIEFDGDGEFLKNLGFIKHANVYQNYAELELIDISRSAELLAGINGKLALRKYEIVEPSLNSIFLSVVGGPEKIEQAAEKPIPDQLLRNEPLGKQIMKDRRVRITMLNFFVAFVITIVFAVFALNGSMEFMPVMILAAATVIACFRFIQVRGKVKKELSKNSLTTGKV
jgi:ABC-2 type transport system ATP-binding protein